MALNFTMARGSLSRRNLRRWFLLGALGALVQAATALSGFAQAEPQPRRPIDDDADLVAFQAQEAEARRRVREEALAATRPALAAITRPEARAVAQALGAVLEEELTSASERRGIVTSFADLDRDGVPELLYQRPRGLPSASAGKETPLPAWALLLLSWDGAAWRASSLLEGDGLFETQVLGGGGLDFAVTVIEGADEIPYPVVFRFRNHAAELVWDSRSAESSYQGYVLGEVEFVHDAAGGAPKLVVTGKADTGAIRFPRLSVRGFLARGTYRWDGAAYVPEQIEFGVNEDFTLHRFLAALRLRDFASAYAAIEPAQFLESDEPTLEMFRERVASVYPEFLGGHVFDARDAGEEKEEDRSFELERNGKLYVYRPRFDGPPGFRLLGIERREEKLKMDD
jgi:hypothetical protein